MTKKLPQKRNDIEKLALDYNKRMQKLQEAKKRTETEKLQKILEDGNKQSAINAAINILRKNCPDVLNADYLSTMNQK
jgi:ABC-2 type transport system ATP-binding protein